MIKKFLIIFNTLKYLKLKQFYFRGLRIVSKPRIKDHFNNKGIKRADKWIDIKLYEEKINQKMEGLFLNYKKKLSLPEDWHKEIPSKLWLYNLHYFEELLSEKSNNKKEFHKSIFDMWINHNPTGYGQGWDPYPSSLRIVNVLKAWLSGLHLDQNNFKSLFEQTSYLSDNLEKHLLANHYFVNLKALLFSGLIFEKEKWRNFSEKELLKELDEQILEDGAHYELSPMYHSLILTDLLDILNLYNAYSVSSKNKLKNKIIEIIPSMIKFLNLLAHNDGSLSHFNDSVDGISPRRRKILKYAEYLGFQIDKADKKTSAYDLSNSGYMVGLKSGNKLIFDAGGIGPDYNPGHAHADTLSFELSIGNEKVFVNSGISEYGVSSKRLAQRKTKAHNTVTVDNKDSSEVWSSFRVGERARIISRSCYIDKNDKIFFKATHNGFYKIFSGPLHTRNIILSERDILIKDCLEGNFKNASAFFHLHPDMKLISQGKFIEIRGKNFLMTTNLTKEIVRIHDSFWCQGFGAEISNKCMEINFSGPDSEIKFSWAKI